MAKGDNIHEGLIDCAVQIIDITSKTLKFSAGKHMACQLMQSGTSHALNYDDLYRIVIDRVKTAIEKSDK